MTDEQDERSGPVGPPDPAGDRSERARPGGGPRPPRPVPATVSAPDDPDAAPGPAPVRPWNQERPSLGGEQHASDPDVVLPDFARRAMPPRLIDNGPPPPSYEPDPAVYDVATDGDGEPRRRRFGRRRRDDSSPADALPSASDAEFDPAQSEISQPEDVGYPSYAPPVETPRAAPAAPPLAPQPVSSSAPASYEPAPLPDEPEPVVPAESVDAPWAGVAPAEPHSEPPAAPGKRPGRWRRGRAKDTVPAVVEPVVIEPVVIEPAVIEPVEPGSVEPGPVTKATRWLLERAPEPVTEPAPEIAPEIAPEPVSETVDVTDAPALDLELADEFHGELEAPRSGAPVADPTEPVTATEATTAPGTEDAVADSPDTVPVATPVSRVRRGWRRRHAAKPADDDEGPFFPPEPADAAMATPVDELPTPPIEPVPTLALPSVASVLDDVPLPAATEVPAVPVSRNRPRPRPGPGAAALPPTPPSADTAPPTPEQVSPARQRPRPRPVAARAAASPAAETSTEPDPAGPPVAPPSGSGDLAEPVAESDQHDTDHHDTDQHKTAESESATADADEKDAADDDAGRRSPDISRYLDGPEAAARNAETEPEEPKRRRRRIRRIRLPRVVVKLLIVLVVAAVAAVVLRTYVVAPYYIPSASMEPALHGGSGTNDRILVDKITYRIHDPHQGDIVVFDRPDTWQVPDKTLVKRVIGLPGDIVSLRSGLVYVNGTRLTENYINPACGAAATKPLTGTSQWTVPMGDYFVMGDNRCDSEDSRAFGAIPGSKIVGRAFLIVWPLNRFGTP